MILNLRAGTIPSALETASRAGLGKVRFFIVFWIVGNGSDPVKDRCEGFVEADVVRRQDSVLLTEEIVSEGRIELIIPKRLEQALLEVDKGHGQSLRRLAPLLLDSSLAVAPGLTALLTLTDFDEGLILL